MKKLLLFASLLFVITGCGNDEKVLKCTRDTDSNGLVSKVTYDIKYRDDDVKYVTITYDYSKSSQTDGVGTGTDGTTEDTNNDDDGIVDGKVKEKVDDITDGVTDTILDLSGIRSTHENRISTYKDYTGFTSHVDTDNNDRYKIVYELDLDKMNDDHLTNFNIDRSLDTTRASFEGEGLTCE